MTWLDKTIISIWLMTIGHFDLSDRDLQFDIFQYYRRVLNQCEISSFRFAWNTDQVIGLMYEISHRMIWDILSLVTNSQSNHYIFTVILDYRLEKKNLNWLSADCTRRHTGTQIHTCARTRAHINTRKQERNATRWAEMKVCTTHVS
jgi:hypothetical protein